MRHTKQALTDEEWERSAPHLPEHPPSPKESRPRVVDCPCLEDILWLLRTGSPWQRLRVAR